MEKNAGGNGYCPKKVSSSFETGIADPQNDINVKLKTEGIANKNSTEETKTIIKKGVQMALEELKKC